MIYDTVICVHPGDKHTVIKAIKSLHYFLDSRKIFLITTRDVYKNIEKCFGKDVPLHFIDEKRVLEGVNLQSFKEMLKIITDLEVSASWYFQQFLKMAVSLRPDVADHYLIWDADTILFQPIRFFDEEGHILFNPRKENHKPYFDFMKRTLNLDKQVQHSFISEHMMIKKAYMIELIRAFEERAPKDKSWVWYVMHTIKKEYLTISGFSEFETYGNFVAFHHKNSYRPRPFKSARNGTASFGSNPNKYDFFRLIFIGFTIVSFEKNQEQSFFYIRAQKIKSFFIYWLYLWKKRCKKMRKTAVLICT